MTVSLLICFSFFDMLFNFKVHNSINFNVYLLFSLAIVNYNVDRNTNKANDISFHIKYFTKITMHISACKTLNMYRLNMVEKTMLPAKEVI